MAKTIILALSLLVLVFCTIRFFFKTFKTKENQFSTRFIARVAIFGALSAILYVVPFLKFPVPIFPSFLEFHFDEIPVFIASFAYGPISGICILLVKTIIKFPFTMTACVGEIADFIYSFVFIIPAAAIYQKHRSFKFVAIGLSIGLVLQLATSIVGNVYVIFPFYMKMLPMSEETLLAVCRLANPAITNIRWSVGFLAVLPFNLIKDVAVIIVTLLIYKSTHQLIDKIAK